MSQPTLFIQKLSALADSVRLVSDMLVALRKREELVTVSPGTSLDVISGQLQELVQELLALQQEQDLALVTKQEGD